VSTPRRWLEEGAPPEVERLLQSASIDEPSAAQLASLAARLAPQLTAPTPPPPPAPAAAASTGVGLVLPTAATVAIAVIGVVGWQLKSLDPAPTPVVVLDAGAALATPTPSLPDAAVATQAPAAPAEPERPAVTPRDVPPPDATGRAPSRDVELELLQEALNTPDATHAWALVVEHERRFPKTDLLQEREVAAIKALGELGRLDDQRLRADHFRVSWPTSPHRLRVESLLDAAENRFKIPAP